MKEQMPTFSGKFGHARPMPQYGLYYFISFLQDSLFLQLTCLIPEPWMQNLSVTQPILVLIILGWIVWWSSSACVMSLTAVRDQAIAATSPLLPTLVEVLRFTSRHLTYWGMQSRMYSFNSVKGKRCHSWGQKMCSLKSTSLNIKYSFWDDQ